MPASLAAFLSLWFKPFARGLLKDRELSLALHANWDYEYSLGRKETWNVLHRGVAVTSAKQL